MKSGKTAKMVGKQPVAFFKGRPASFAFLFYFTFTSASLLSADGGRVGELFNYGAGARPISMGGAFTAVSRDAASVYYNPSGLGMLARPNVQLMHSALFEGAYYDFIGYAGNFNRLPGGWGLELIRLAGAGAEGRDAYNNRTSGFNYSETALAAAGGLKGIYFSKLSVGVSFKFLNRALADSADRHFACDLGLQYGPLLRGRLDLGLVAANTISFAGGDTSDKLPVLVKAGAAYRIAGEILLAAEIDGDGKFRIGSEYAMAIGSLRAGLDDNMVSFGLGTVLLSAYSLDLAITRHPVLGLSNNISLGYQFGSGGKNRREDKPAALAKDYLEKAQKALNERQYPAFLENIGNAMAMDHSLAEGKWGERNRRMSAVVEKLNLKYNIEKQKAFSRAGEQAAMAQTALTAYMDAQELKSMLYAHAAAGADIREAAFEEFLKLLSGLTGLPVRQDEILPRLTLINEKMRKADLNFQVMKFDLAAKECEEVLLLDEHNLLTRIRLGSAYFAIGDLKRAREAYETALELDPGNTAVLEFMKLKGWEKGK
ncbi:MAG: tetratricopeptide repeat protein [Elusimicrobia bacterium]|nr:tetratricopeptide repeat protein [Elusimicrobiota bacterium]